MALNVHDLYRVSGTDKVHDMEVELKAELEALKNEIEEYELLHSGPTRTISSVPLPKSADYFKRERKVVIDRALQVSEAQPLKVQAELMKEEMFGSEELEYTPDSLPLLLHQYYCDRIHQLVQCKHMHMLRWKRFCEHSSTIESLYPLYQRRLSQILMEYNDCTQRAQRLSIAREAYLCNNNQMAVNTVTQEDLMIYLRWLVCHFHSVKKFSQYLRVLQWVPVIYKSEISPPEKEGTEQEEVTTASKMASRYQEDSSGLFQRPKSGMSRPGSGASPRAQSPIPAPPAINPSLLSTAPLPSSSMAYAAAASGGGLATDEGTLGLPLNVIEFHDLKPHLSFLLNIYGINFDLESITNTADEMEMFAAVNRKFKHIFNRQQHMKTFKTYDRLEVGQENWGSDSPIHALKQESNWLPFIKLKAERDPTQEQKWTQLRQFNNIDELVRVQAHFIHVSDPDKVQDILRDHASAVRSPPQIQALSKSHHSQNNPLIMWKKIYSNPHLYSDDASDVSVTDLDDRDEPATRVGSGRKRKESYNYVDTVQMLGLDEGEQDRKDPATVQGAYLSFLHLRHLRLRDLQRSCLGILNYFRSVERTLTINDGGLSQESGSFKRTSPQNHRNATETDGTVGGGGGLGNHGYVHNTPADFKLNETEFMEFSEVENHDDFYMIEDGRIHVQDQRGYYVMYEAAVDDVEALEKDIMLIGTHYIEKDRELRGQSKITKATDSARRRQQSVAGDFDIARYAHQEVDRFGVMLDLWTNETAFLECKRELLDCYLEAYHHVTDREEKRALAQVIINIMYKRPRFDFSSEYFVKTYRAECVVLRQHMNLIKGVLDRQIEEQREYIQKVCREGDKDFGLPHRIIPKQPISVNHSKPALKNVFILEFHPSLATASKVPDALKYALQELLHVHKPESVYDALVMEKKLYEVALKEWTKLDPIGGSFSPQMQKDLFSEVFVEDPLFVCEIAQSLVAQEEQDQPRRTAKEKQSSMIAIMARILEAVTLRHRLLDVAWETEILARLYKKQALEMGFDDFHMNLRFVQMEFAGYKEDAGKPPPIFITSVQEDELAVDRVPTTSLSLAIQELDEGQLGRFSFRSRDGLLKIMHPGGMESFQVVLKCQIVHKNALICAVQQANACQPMKEQEWKSGRASPTETKSEKSSLTQLTGMSSGTGGTSLGSKLQAEPGSHRKRSPEAFISIQLEKTPSRDLMLNDFITKKNQMGTILRNPEEMEKLKRGLVSNFCFHFNQRMGQYSIRGQLISYYNSILHLLEDFPSVRDTYFMLGDPNEKKTNMDGIQGMEPDPRTMRRRPRQLLSGDGKHVLNIWFIPHHTETLIMFKKLDDDKCVKALSHCLMIVSALHDMLHYLCAHSRLGSSHARLGSQKMEFTSADWGGTEGIGAELREVQKQIDNLPDPTHPDTVTDFLALRRDVMFLEFDTAVRHCMADTFLSTGNVQAYKSVINNTFHALPALSNVQRPTLFSTYLPVPEPLEARDFQARSLFPWRSFLGRNGPYPLMFWQWHMIEYYIQLCLAGLKDVDRHVANGEILGVTLLMEDVLQTGYQDVELLQEHHVDDKGDKKTMTRTGSAQELKRSVSALGSTSKLERIKPKATLHSQSASLSRTQEPIKAYKLLKFFLLLWKCLEYLKSDWGKRKLGVESIDLASLYREFCKVYKMEMLLPVMQSVARRLGQGEMYDGIALDTDPLVMPRGASEIEVRSKQLTKLLETLECHMIAEVKKKLEREITLARSERQREESANPSDLWKRSSMKESFTISKPHVSEKFVSQLMSDVLQENEEDISFSKKHLAACMAELSRTIMAREKHNFESYTMYYENLLRQTCHQLYLREQEVKQVKDQLKSSQNNAMVEVQCQLAAQAHDLLMEITALRAKIAEMRQMSFTQQRDIRERVREEYDELIQSLFNSSFQLRNKFDEFRNELHEDLFEKISETRREAFENISKVKQKYGTDADDTDSEGKLSKSRRLRHLQHENHVLNTLVLKMKAMKIWRQNHDTVNFLKKIRELKKESENSKKEYQEIKMLAEEDVTMLKQRLAEKKKQLAAAEREANEVRKKLEKELKEKQEKSHEAMQRARSQKQLEQAKQANIEKLVEELEDKEQRLKMVSEDFDKNQRFQSLQQEKIKRNVESIRKQLSHERNLKLEAFNRVDDLQAQVYDYESCVSRSQSVMNFSPATRGRGGKPAKIIDKSFSRAQSATQRHSLPPSRGTPSSGLWPPTVIWPVNRTLTPEVRGHPMNNEDTKISRPKTVGGRLRSRIAEQLLNELDYDHHQTIVQLEELQLEGGKGKEVNY